MFEDTEERRQWYDGEKPPGPEETAAECKGYTTTKKLFGWGPHDCGAVAHWLKTESGEIIPWDPQADYNTWFRYGFYMAIKALGGVPDSFEKKCTNCHLSNKHFVNACEKNELCDKWELDYQRAYDYRYYGNLCDSCEIAKDCEEKCNVWSQWPKQRCEKWVKPPKENDGAS